MKKKWMIGIAAFFLAGLMVSSVTVAYVTQVNEQLNSITGFEAYESRVDPNIYLTRKNLQTLVNGLSYVEDSDTSAFVQEIINTIQEKGYVNNKDIGSIQRNLGLFPIVRAGFISSNGAGTAISGRVLIRGFFGFPAQVMRFSVFANWIGADHIDKPATTQLNLLTVTGNQRGFIFGFLGGIGNSMDFGGPSSGVYYGVIGIGSLIIVFADAVNQ